MLFHRKLPCQLKLQAFVVHNTRQPQKRNPHLIKHGLCRVRQAVYE